MALLLFGAATHPEQFDSILTQYQQCLNFLKLEDVGRVDVFHLDSFIGEADGWREEAWLMIRRRSDLHFYMVTKRPERIAHCLPDDWGDAVKS